MLLDGGVLMRNSAKRETIYLKTQSPPMNSGIEQLRPATFLLDGVTALILAILASCDF
jgi:hypothetical protein